MQSMQVARMSRALKALSDSNRIRILEILVQGEYCVSDLVDRLAIDQPKVSHHLAILRSAGVIRSRREGRHINYSIKPTVHRLAESAEGPTHVFDLVDLCVTFRFPAASAGAGSSSAAAGPGSTSASAEAGRRSEAPGRTRAAGEESPPRDDRRARPNDLEAAEGG